MVLRDIEEEVEETEPMSPSPKKRKPLHNFTFPFLKWGTQRNLRCSNAAINDGAGTSTSGGGGDHRSSSATPSGSVQRRRVVIGFGGDDDDDDDDDQGIAVVREKLMHDLKTATDRMKNAILNEESDEASEEERESLNLKSWSIRKRQKTEMKAPITISGNANAKRDFTSPARIDGAVAVAGGNSVSSRLRSNITSSNKIERQKFSLHLLSKEALLCPASATTLACAVCIAKFIEDGIIDSEGNPTEKQEIQISPDIPMIDTTNFPWRGMDKIFFDHIVQEMQTINFGEWWLCNTTCDLEPGVFSISPKFLPIGPLMSNDNNKSSFWQEDTTCLDWLDKQVPQSVIYVSFGSLVVMDQNQFNELALGLDLLDKPFLWVVRPNNDNKVNYAYPNDFHGNKGKIVDWAPQRKLLNHPAIACFISHCGWNSTIEGVHAGAPFLCWPFFTDQFLNKSYICDVWKIGLELEKDDKGFISRQEIRKKVDQVVGDDDIKAMCLKMKKMTINNIEEGGQSSHNLQKFISWANY